MSTAANALKHGLRATDELFIAHLDPAERAVFEDFRASIHAEYHPLTVHEHLLVDQIAIGHFRLYRLYRLEDQAARDSTVQPLAPQSILSHLDRVSRYDSRLERQLRNLHNRLKLLYAKRGDHSLATFGFRE